MTSTHRYALTVTALLSLLVFVGARPRTPAPAVSASDDAWTLHLPTLLRGESWGTGSVPGPSEWSDFSNPGPTYGLALTPDSAGLWTATAGGALRWSLAGGQLDRYSSAEGPLSNAQLDVALTPDGSAWFVSEDGVSRWHAAEGWELFPYWRHPELEHLKAVAVAPDGTLYVGGVGLHRYGGSGDWLAVEGTLGAPSVQVEDIAFGKDGELWLATNGGASRRLPDGSWQAFGPAEGMLGYPSTDAFVDAAGNAWIGSASRSGCPPESAAVCGSVARITPSGELRVFSEADGLGANAVHAIAQTADGSLWFGAANYGGVHRIRGLSRLAPDGLWTVYETLGERALDEVFSLLATADGGLWIGTGSGLLHRAADGAVTELDPRPFGPLPAASLPSVFDSVMGPDGRLWLGTVRGLLLREPDATWKLLYVDDRLDPDAPGGLDNRNVVESLALDAEGMLWVGTRKGLFLLDPHAGFEWLEPRGNRGMLESWISDIETTPEGGLWVGTYSNGAWRRDAEGRWTLFTDMDLPDDTIADIEIGPDGRAWIATFQGSVVVGPEDRVQRLVGADAPACQTRDIGIDPEGRVWFGANGFGCDVISRRDPDGRWTHYPYQQHGQASVADIAVDVAGNVWFGSWSRLGVSMLAPDGHWQRYRSDSGLAFGDVWSITAAQGPEGEIELWFGTLDGISRLRLTGEDAATPRATPSPRPSATATPTRTPASGEDPPRVEGSWRYLTEANGVVALALAGDRVWAGTGGGLVEWEPGSGASRKLTAGDGLKRHAVSALARGADGSLWVGARSQGAVRLLPDASLEAVEPGDQLLDGDVLAIEAAPDGSIWFGTGQGTARRLPAGDWEQHRAGQRSVAGMTRAIAFAPDGTGYFGTYASGLSRREPGGAWRTYTQRDGLGSDQVLAVAVGADGRAWVASGGYDDQGSIGYLDILQPEGRFARVELGETLRENLIWRIRFDAAGSAWLATSKGLLVPVGADAWRLESASPEDAELGAYDLAIEASGQVWLATGRGLVRRSPEGGLETFRREELPSNAVRRLDFDAEGTLWADAGGLARLSGEDRWERFDASDALADAILIDFALSEAGDLWATTSAGLTHRSAAGAWTTYTQAEGLLSHRLGRLLLGPSLGELWVATEGEPGVGGQDGVNHRRADGSWEGFTAADGLARGGVRALARDLQGGIWLGMRLWSGLPHQNLSWRSPEGSWSALAVPGSREGSTVNAVVVDPLGARWFGSSQGVARLGPDDRWTTWTEDPALAFPADRIRLAPDGSLWFAGETGRVRVRYPDGRWGMVLRAEGLAMDSVRDIAFGPGGEVWFAGESISVLTPR